MSYIGILSLPTPTACEPTYCEEWTVEPDGALVCFDVDERYQAGHWEFSECEDEDLNLQSCVYVTTEY